MSTPLDSLQSGLIRVIDPDKAFKALNITADPNGGTYELNLISGDNKLTKPRQIQMDAIPSASIIELTSREMQGGQPKWKVTFKTTHHTAWLNIVDVHLLLDSYLPNDFIKNALGLVMTQASGLPATRDTLGKVRVVTSRAAVRASANGQG